MRINPGKIYRHADGGWYRVLDLRLKMKHPDTGEWLKAVSYEDEGEDYGTGTIYVRTQKDFVARFKPVKLPKNFSCCGGSDEHPPHHTQDCPRRLGET